MIEVSIKDAAHEDAQYPSETSLQNTGVDTETTEELQITFVSGIPPPSACRPPRLDYAWAGLREMVDSGKLFNPKMK